MEQITPGLHVTRPHELGFGNPPLRARSFLIRREQGNLAIYGAGPILEEVESVKDLGGASRQYLNHWHEAMAEADQLGRILGAPLHVNRADAADAGRVAQVGETFEERHMVGDDLEVIPIPGHTAGATAFLWSGPESRVLFTGDSIFTRDGEWGAAFLDASSIRPDYVESVELLATLEFDLLAPGVGTAGEPPVTPTGPEDSKRRLLEIAERLRAGRDR